MPHWDHMCEMADDFAMAKLTLGDEEAARRYRVRRILAVAFVPAFLLLLYLAALYGNKAAAGIN
jgi:hypothetical protein